MNLHGMVSNLVGAVNPFVPAFIQVSAGYVTAPDGERTPAYKAAKRASVQVQALQGPELALVEGLNIGGIKRAIYVTGKWEGLNRPDKKGGDIVTMLDGQTWLVTVVLEYWPDWCKVAVTLQNGS